MLIINSNIMKNDLIIFHLLIFIPNLVFSQNRKRSKSKIDFPVISIGPQIGGNIFYGGDFNMDAKIHFNYSFGSFIILRPFQSFGMETELNYGKWIGSYSFYEIPALLHIYNRSNLAFKFGPVFNFPNLDKNSNYKDDPQIGVRIGAGTQFTGFYFEFSKNPFLENTINDSSFLIGFGLKLRLSLINF